MSQAHAPSIRAIPFDHTWPAGLATELLTDQQRRHLAEIATVRFVPPRTTLFHAGDQAESVFIVSRGVMKAYRELRNGKQRVMAFLFPSDVLGLAEGGRYVNNAQALTPATLYGIRMDTLKDSFRRDFALQFHFLCKVTHELRESQLQTIGIARRDASGKLATFLEMLQRNSSLREEAEEAPRLHLAAYEPRRHRELPGADAGDPEPRGRAAEAARHREVSRPASRADHRSQPAARARRSRMTRAIAGYHLEARQA